MDRPKESLLDCIIRKPVFLKVGDVAGGAPFKSGCSVIDVLFPGYDTVNIDCITFQNNYTASIEIKVKVNDGKGDVWKVCLKRHPLMPQPHYEAGSQDYITITSDMMLCETSDVIMVRLILRQPSPHWNSFGIENLKFFMPSSLSSLVSSPAWLSVDDDDSSVAAKAKHQGLPESDDVADLMQQMWAMTQEIKGVSKPGRPIGRFEVDGSYDINLLSYT